MKCDNCGKEYDDDKEGVHTENKFTGAEKNFCSDGCCGEGFLR